jgi:Dynamin family
METPAIQLANQLKATLGALEIARHSPMYREVLAASDRLADPNFRIAVFGPFNYGKSTLINALMGDRALPMDIIPTTGAAIYVRYGAELQTKVIFKDGKELVEMGTEILKQFAILDGDRRMREDVLSVEVLAPHPFLKNNVELLDLPGTNDREAQDALVKEKLLTCDLIVQILDGRQLMTLGERENLRDWLLDRGIKTVVFVVNFLNLLAAEEQKEVYNRLRFVAESFRADLPAGISNLYRVDALPALRARLKGDTAAAHSSGLVGFESALQTIVAVQHEKLFVTRLPRIVAIAQPITRALQSKITALASELAAAEAKQQAKVRIQQQAAQLIQSGFAASLAEFRQWLSLSALLSRYQFEALAAWQQQQFQVWESSFFQLAIAQKQADVVKWVMQASEIFDVPPSENLLIPFPSSPVVSLPNKPTEKPDIEDTAPVAVATGLGWVLGGPVGAAVVGGASYLLNRNLRQEKQESADESYRQQVAQLHTEAIQNYFQEFSDRALTILQQYEQRVAPIINFSGKGNQICSSISVNR